MGGKDNSALRQGVTGAMGMAAVTQLHLSSQVCTWPGIARPSSFSIKVKIPCCHVKPPDI